MPRQTGTYLWSFDLNRNILHLQTFAALHGVRAPRCQRSNKKPRCWAPWSRLRSIPGPPARLPTARPHLRGGRKERPGGAARRRRHVAPPSPPPASPGGGRLCPRCSAPERRSPAAGVGGTGAEAAPPPPPGWERFIHVCKFAAAGGGAGGAGRGGTGRPASAPSLPP